ncbi:MAG TPA: DUF2188 domain-containing protein [Planctomycetota bacterium]|jgi:hypothetical protein
MIKVRHARYAIYRVVPDEKEWLIRSECGRVVSRHRSRESALERAKERARAVSHAVINVFGKDGKLHTHYQYGASLD